MREVGRDPKPGQLIEEFEVQGRYADPPPDPDYNGAPTKTSTAVLARTPKDAAEDADPVRQLRNLRWSRRGPRTRRSGRG